MLRRGVPGFLIAALALIVALPASAATPPPPTKYTLAGNCYDLKGPAGQTGASKLRMQATRLGSYLLYRTDHTILAVQSDGTVAPDADASPAADWALTDAAGGAFTMSPASDPTRTLSVGPGGALTANPGAGTAVTFAAADGCAVYPEAQLNATGTPSRGKTSFGAVGGLLEGHMHWMTYEYLGGKFHCGKPWSPYGIPYALPDCSDIEGPQGSTAIVQNFLNYGSPVKPHDTTGWPKLTEWSAHNLTYEGTYWKWIQRAWTGGLRMMVMSVNENRVLCQLIPQKSHSCDEMETVHQGFRDINELQDYVDAQAGGPGKGFFQIVTNPYQARRVINEGKMAVVLEIEASELFGCKGLEGTSSCDKAQIDRELDSFYDQGVRSSLLLNKFDNPLTGVRFDSGTIGGLINAANKDSSGSFWDAKTCTSPLHDNPIDAGGNDPTGTLALAATLLGIPGGTVPSYPPAPHCNTRGLTDLGAYVEERMMQKHMIINPDHMSQAGVADTLTLAEAHNYSGLISPHGWMDPGNWPRIWKLGGLAFPDSNTSTTYVKDYDTFRPKQTPYLLGWGYGADLGGLAAQPDPPAGDKGTINYPFKSADGKVTLTQQTTGDRTFDYRNEGVATYGQYPEWYNDVDRLGGPKLAKDMWNGAEAYLEMWERADGIKAPNCRARLMRVKRGGLRNIRLRVGWAKLLKAAGQPQQRNRAWSYCVRGKKNKRAADVAELNMKGNVELVGTTARGRRAGGIRVGSRVKSLPASVHKMSPGIYMGRKSKSSVFVYHVMGGHVRIAATATRKLAKHPKQLRMAMKRVLHARGSQAPRKFVANPSAISQRLSGSTLAGSNNPQLNRTLHMLCTLNRG